MFVKPTSSGKIRKGIYYHRYANGTINIMGEKFIGYSIKDAVRIWRRKHPKN